MIRSDPVESGQADSRRYANPTASEVAMIVDTFEKKRNIVLELRPDASKSVTNPLGLQNIDITHQFYLALSYPLMFIRG